MRWRDAVFFLIALIAKSVYGQQEVPTLQCVGKVAPESEVKAMSSSDIHSFIVVPSKDWETIALYRDFVSDKSMFDLYLSPKVDQTKIFAVNPQTSLLVDRINGRFQITHSIKQIGRTVIFGGYCDVMKTPREKKF